MINITIAELKLILPNIMKLLKETVSLTEVEPSWLIHFTD